MEHIFLVDPIGKLLEKYGLLEKVALFNRLGRFNGSISFHSHFSGFPSSSRPFTIYFRFFPILREMESACSEQRDFLIEIFAFHLHRLKPDGFFT